MVFSDLKKMCSCLTPNTTNLGGLTSKELRALKTLTQNNNLIIKTADKGGEIVIQNRLDCIQEADCLLADSSTYSKLSSDPLPEFQKEIN